MFGNFVVHIIQNEWQPAGNNLVQKQKSRLMFMEKRKETQTFVHHEEGWKNGGFGFVNREHLSLFFFFFIPIEFSAPNQLYRSIQLKVHRGTYIPYKYEYNSV